MAKAANRTEFVLRYAQAAGALVAVLLFLVLAGISGAVSKLGSNSGRRWALGGAILGVLLVLSTARLALTAWRRYRDVQDRADTDLERVARHQWAAAVWRLAAKTPLGVALILLYATRWPGVTLFLRTHPLILYALILYALALFTIWGVLDTLWDWQFQRLHQKGE